MKRHGIYDKCHLSEFFVVVVNLAETLSIKYKISFANFFIRNTACFLKIDVNPFVSNAPFLNPLKTSENLTVC